MAQTAQPVEQPGAGSTSAYVSMQLEHGRPGVLLSHGMETPRTSGAAAISLAAHVLFVALLLLAIRAAPPSADQERPAPPPSIQLVFLNEPGPGGGGGGGGNQQQAPPRKLELPGPDRISVPVAPKPTVTPPKQDPPKRPDPPEVPAMNIPVQTLASGTIASAGVIDISAPSAPASTSQGSGSGGGAGTGTGTGVGSGQGSGLGEGFGGGTGGGVYRPGSGVSSPALVSQVKPQYTTEAMRAKIQGKVWLEVVVMPDGRPGNIRIVRSLDRTFGLDEEAIKAMRQWRFRPGTRQGEAVAVAVTVEMEFTLR
jgi:periplasmic protein TonB